MKNGREYIAVGPSYDKVCAEFYSEQHKIRTYGTGGIEVLPEAALYLLNAVSTGRIAITVEHPLHVLDYGCGGSQLAAGMVAVLTPSLAAIRKGEINPRDVRALFRHAASSLCSVMENPASLAATPLMNSAIKASRYDPFVPGLNRPPNQIQDYVICTDVLEHIPEVSAPALKSCPLRDTLKAIDALSGAMTARGSFFLNASSHLAPNQMPDGRNVHCTIKTAAEWRGYVSALCGRMVTSILSRDLMACSFTKGDVLEETREISYELVARFGRINRLEYPPPSGTPDKKAAALRQLQPHKRAVIWQTATDWIRQYPESVGRPEYRRLLKGAFAQARVNGA